MQSIELYPSSMFALVTGHMATHMNICEYQFVGKKYTETKTNIHLF